MKKVILLFILIVTFVFSSEVKEEKWPQGETFLTFLEKYSISTKLYFNLEKEDKELCSEITAGKYYFLKENEDGTLDQVLIPVSEEIQLHLYKDISGNYKFQTLPITYREYTETIAIPITSSVSNELQKATGSAALAANLKSIFSGVRFTQMRKGDFIAVEYTQKELLGRPFGQPEIKAAMVEVRGKKYYRFKNEKDDKYYDQKAKSFTKVYFFKIPLTYKRISSHFTKKRYHPVLKRYRAHLGTDFAAPRGRKVKRGQHIGYVGSTGLSSGPHLHLGLYKNGRAINPLKVIRKAETVGLKGKRKKTFIANAKIKINNFEEIIKDDNRPLATRLDRLVSKMPLPQKEI